MNKKAESKPMNDTSMLTFDVGHLIHLLLSKAWVVILFVIFTLVAAVAYLVWAPKIYESQAVIEVAQETPRVNNIQDFNGDGADLKLPEVLKTIEQVLLSDTLLLRVVKSNGLDKDPKFAPPKKDGSAYLDTELVGKFARKVNVKVRRATRLIDITVGDTDPQRAQQYAESMVKEFVNQSFEQELGLSETANNYLRAEADRLKVKLQAAEQGVQLP